MSPREAYSTAHGGCGDPIFMEINLCFGLARANILLDQLSRTSMNIKRQLNANLGKKFDSFSQCYAYVSTNSQQCQLKLSLNGYWPTLTPTQLDSVRVYIPNPTQVTFNSKVQELGLVQVSLEPCCLGFGPHLPFGFTGSSGSW